MTYHFRKMTRMNVCLCMSFMLIITVWIYGTYLKFDDMEPFFQTVKVNTYVLTPKGKSISMSVNMTREGFITIYCQGRLGNLLYEYFSLIGIASSNGMEPILCKNMTLTLGLLFNMSEIKTIDPKRKYNWTEFKEKAALKYDAVVRTLNNTQNWKLVGYFQSWRYFLKSERFIRGLHSPPFNDQLLKKSEDFFLNITCPVHQSSCIKIAVHIRRGDTMTQKLRDIGYLDVPATYYHKAMDYFRSKFCQAKVIFIIASDDMGWCRQNFNGSDVYLSTMKSAEEDMVLLGQCDHAIIGQGSFGRVIGFFTGGEVIYYKAWPRPNSFLSNITNHSDIYLASWIGME